MATVAAHYESHLAPVYLWMAGGIDLALSTGDADIADVACPGGVAVDLGAGFGMHAIPLARRGLPGAGDRLVCAAARSAETLRCGAAD